MLLSDKLAQNLDLEDDNKGQFQQVSGGFGDSTNLDEEATKLLLAHQARAEELAIKFAPIDPAKWEQVAEDENYVMESNLFDYTQLQQSPTFGLKNYSEAVYRGEL